jgi:hypothetical protein
MVNLYHICSRMFHIKRLNIKGSHYIFTPLCTPLINVQLCTYGVLHLFVLVMTRISAVISAYLLNV